ncbi:hypothetical protein [Dyadobacter sandarakinus]|uniref:Phage integrase SAM-like domain-containing protein n=1 Tax=Dyadobacter sandarakinus TaxID=2747268 RepID=A0ABX7I2D7_9BACT|nr:hypothetical protein [Dyadobacter sandarakinus]QRQ99706.1 hypothetical protein HWI92_01640 [Dyadobacter sandarakinus]
MVTLENKDLQLTKAGFLKIFDKHRASGMTIQDAYYAVVDYCRDNGYDAKYSTFESFKTRALYAAKPKSAHRIP